MSQSYDEISLRDLYLVFRRGLPTVLGVAVLCAAAAFGITSLMPEVYEAETTVLINPSPVRVQGSASLALDQRNDVSYETYTSIAFSRSVLEDALNELGGDRMSVSQLRAAGRLEKLVGPQRPDQVAQLTISHQIVDTEPELAALAADAWARATVASVKQTLLASLTPVQNTTSAEVARLQAQLDELQDRWKTFQTGNEGAILEAQLKSLAERIANGEAQVDQLTRDIAAAGARREVLDRLLATDPPGASADGDPQVQLELLRAQELLTEETAAQIAALLQTPEGADSDLLTLVSRLERQQETTEAAGLLAERDALRAQLADYHRQAQALRERQAQLQLQSDELQRQLTTVQDAYANVAALEPVINYINELAPNNSRILSQASVPTDPIGPRRTLITAAAALAGGMLALLFVFIREAVADPNAAAPGRRRQRVPVR